MNYMVIGFSQKKIQKIIATQTSFDAVRIEYELQVANGIDETNILPIDAEGNVLNDQLSLLWQARFSYIQKLRRKEETE